MFVGEHLLQSVMFCRRLDVNQCVSCVPVGSQTDAYLRRRDMSLCCAVIVSLPLIIYGLSQ